GRGRLVAEQAPLLARGWERPIEEDGLSAGAFADDPGQAQVGAAGDDPLLARRQVEVRAALRDHAVHDEEPLAGTADGEGLDGRDPGFLPPRREVTGIRGSAERVTPVHLADRPELALDHE